MPDKRNARKSRAQLARDIEEARRDLGLTQEGFAEILWNRHTTNRTQAALINDVFAWEARGMNPHNAYFIPCCEELGLIAEDYMSSRYSLKKKAE